MAILGYVGVMEALDELLRVNLKGISRTALEI